MYCFAKWKAHTSQLFIDSREKKRAIYCKMARFSDYSPDTWFGANMAK